MKLSLREHYMHFEIFDEDTDNCDVVATVPKTLDDDYDKEIVTPNAHMFAASRELFECCKKALAAYDAATITGTGSWAGKDVDDMRAAVAKATVNE